VWTGSLRALRNPTMFLWWRNLMGSGKDVVPTPEEVAADEAVKQEIAEMEEVLNHGPSRPSVVSKSKYSKWETVEANRMKTEALRAELDALEAQRLQSIADFVGSGHDRTQQAKEQREAAAARVKQHKAEMQEKGMEEKRAMEERKQEDARRKQAFAEVSLKIVQMHGSEQRERTLESRTERFENNRRAAADLKQDVADRAAKFAETLMRRVEEKRQRVAAIRDQTKTEVIRQSKEMFAQRKQETAKDVRTSVKSWNAEKEYNHQQALTRARHNKSQALSSRGNVVEQRSVLIEHRKKDAMAIKNGLQAIKDRKQHQKLSAEVKNREAHDDLFEQKFVSAAQAETLVASSYDSISNVHLDELAARDGKMVRVVPKQSWVPWFSGGGDQHSGWFGGQHIDLQAL